MTFHGPTSGNLDRDAESTRLFARDGHQFALIQTYSKNMGLTSERVECLSMITGSAEETDRVTSQLKTICRHMYSNPPANGVRIANEIFTDPELKDQWIKEIQHMKNRLIMARKILKEELDKTGLKLNWDYVTNQIGLFCYPGFSPDQVQKMREKHSIYVSTDSRITLSHITSENVERVARALHDVTKDSLNGFNGAT